MVMEPLKQVESAERVHREWYPNGQLAVFLKDREGKPLAEISVMDDSVELGEHEFIFKDYSENLILASKLITTGIIVPTKRFVIVGSHVCPTCHLHV